ncbi:MAG: P-loop NTPase [Solirubrobacteraceae bacterium]
MGITDMTAKGFLQASKVTANATDDVLTFRASDGDPDRAVRLATAYAREFIAYRRGIDGGAYVRQVGDAFLVAPAERATKTDPETSRNFALALALALIGGILLAFLREGLDTRVRSAAEIVGRLDLPLLGRLPRPPRRLRRAGAIVMLAEPNDAHAEPFRVLRTSLLLRNAEYDARTIMLTSATSGEGKTTTAANLAVALARTGRRVILVDLDLRRPSLHRLFGLAGHPGLADAVLGRVSLDAALAPALAVPTGDDGSNAGTGRDALLQVLPAGSIPRDVGDFVAGTELARFLSALRERADVVLIDGPPLLETGDGVTVSREVDALAVVARVGETRRPTLDELGRVLAMCRTHKLGVVVTAARREGNHRESFASARTMAPPQPAPMGGSNGSIRSTSGDLGRPVQRGIS